MTDRSVVLTEHDFDRLHDLIQSPRFRVTHAPMVVTLERELERSEVVAPTSVPKGTVTMNSRVQFRDVEGDESETYTLVYPAEADVDAGKLSVLAPLGAALLGASAGDVVECRTPGGVRRLRIEEILYQPEAAGDYHL